MSRQLFGPFAMLVFLGVVLFAADQALHSASEPSATRYPQPLPAFLDPDRSNLTQQELEDLARDRKNFKQQRQAYFDGLHRAAPGTDWRAMDRETRTQLARERMAARASMLDRGLDPSVLPVTINTRTRAVTGTWAEKGSDNLAGRMHVADIHNSTIYAGSSGGIVWRGTLTGDDWTPLNDWLQMDDIVSVDVLPGAGAGDHRLVVFHRGTDMVHYSDDDGVSWQAAPGVDGPVSWGGPMRGDVMGDAGQTMFLLAQEWDYDQWHGAVGFYRSGDQGASFQRLQLFDQERHRADMWCPSTTSGPGYLVRGNDIHSFDALGNVTPQGTLTVSHDDGQVRRTQLRGRIGPNGLDLYVGNEPAT